MKDKFYTYPEAAAREAVLDAKQKKRRGPK